MLREKIDSNSKFTEIELKDIYQQIALGLTYLHAHGAIHRDLTCSNILLQRNSTTPSGFIVKVGDFGLASVPIDNEQIDPMNMSLVGTVLSRAPEMLAQDGCAVDGDYCFIGSYTNKVDMWSLGFTLYEAITYGCVPFQARSVSELKQQIQQVRSMVQLPQQVEVPADLRDLVSKLLTVDPNQRLSAEEFLHHPWMSSQQQQQSEVMRQEMIGKFVFSRSVFNRLGEGSFGSVFHGYNVQDSTPVAVKVVDLAHAMAMDTGKAKEHLDVEVKVMSQFSHQNVLRCHESIWSNKELLMVLDYCDGGDLGKFIEKKRTTVNENEWKDLFRQIGKGMKFLHKKGVYHRDIKDCCSLSLFLPTVCFPF